MHLFLFRPGLLLVMSLLTTSMPAQDLNAFWRATRERLADEPMEAQVEAVVEALPYRKFKVTLRGLDGVRFSAWLALPIKGEVAQPKPWPVIVTVPGYGGLQQGIMLGECQRGYAILQVFPRSQGDATAFWKIDGPDKLTWRLDKPEGAYYQGAYADVIRAIDFVVTRTDLDAQRIAMMGTSQGGGISLAVGALDSRIKAVVAHVPFLCDFRLAAKTPDSLVKKLLDEAGRNDEAALATLDYFDPLQLAPQLRVPVLMSAGGQDKICPVSTIQAVYNRLPGVRSLMIYPDLPHTTCLDFYDLSWRWLDLHFRD